MSEIKFACPVCGQHITCAAGSSGSPMPCPTCFRQLIVPPATASGTSNLVRTASEVSSRPGLRSEHGGAVVPTRHFPWAALGSGLLICGAAAGAFTFRARIFQVFQQAGQGEAHRPGATAESSVDGSQPGVSASKWTLDLATATIPVTPVTGRINGKNFASQQATIIGGMLVLGEATTWPPKVGMAVEFFARRAEDLAGKTVIIEASRVKAPRLLVRWQDGQGQTVTQEYSAGYALRVEFGQLMDRRLPGKIYLAAPDPDKSYLAGTFDAEIRKP